MNPVAFNLFGIQIMWYGIFIATGVMAAIVTTVLFLKRAGIYNEDHFFGLIASTVISGFIGARFWYVIFNLSLYSNLWEMLNIRQGGLAFQGGILFGLTAILAYCKWKKLDVLRYLDFIAVGTLLAQAIGRWGNFFNQEAHGSAVSESFISHFPTFIRNGMLIKGVYYHPTFLYESLSDLLWVVLLTILILRFPKIRKGAIFALALIGNSLTRIAVESLRTDSLMLGDIKVAQLFGVIGIFFGLVFLLYLYTEDLRTGKSGKGKGKTQRKQ